MANNVATRQPELVTLVDNPYEPWQEVLLKAADILEKTGWVPGALLRGQAHCAVGAMVAAHKGTRGDRFPHELYNDEVLTEAAVHLGAFTGYSRGDVSSVWDSMQPIDKIVTWNDRVGHSQHDVAKAMRDCVAASRKHG